MSSVYVDSVDCAGFKKSSKFRQLNLTSTVSI